MERTCRAARRVPGRLRLSALAATIAAASLTAFASTPAGQEPAGQTSAGQVDPETLASTFRWRSIGPSNMMGRVATIDALDSDWRVVLVGAATGGVWKSTDGGVSFEPIFDGYGSQSIGDVAFFQPDPDIIWVGTGEDEGRNSAGWGDGLWKSTDGGVTFRHMGLGDTYTIGEIRPHPTDPDVVYVAAMGNLWGFDGSRGLFKTTDGGETWQQLANGLPDDPRIGARDVAIHPDEPDVIYAGMYYRLRRPWRNQSGGPGGGIFKSTDAGATFRKLTNGLPTGPTGQIDIDIYRQDPSFVAAFVEADETLTTGLDVPSSGVYLSRDAGATWQYVARNNSRPYYHGRVRIHPTDPNRLYVPSRQYMHSTDGGRTWQRGKGFPSAGGDDHDLWISPTTADVFYAATDQGANVSFGGEELRFQNMAIGQYYAIGVDHRIPYWVYGGLQDNGGWAIPSHVPGSGGIGTQHAIEVNGGDGFHMDADSQDWRIVYTTVHVGYFGRIDMETGEQTYITPTPDTIENFDEHYDPDFAESQIDYTINPEEDWIGWEPESRTINGAQLPPQFRWNWNSPLMVSPHDGATIYVGGNHLFESTDRGETWRIISPDLTRNDPETRNSSENGGLVRDATGAENYNTIFAVGVSPVDADVIWTGTDDGYVQVTQDRGQTWTNVTANIPDMPEPAWVSRIAPSHFDAGTAYVSVDNHRMGDMQAYIFRTSDYGQTWTDLAAPLPDDTPGLSVRVVVEDHVNPNLLFIGTEFGVWYSIDQGRRWARFMNGLPPVPVYDLVIHPRDNDLVAGTHGRSIWIVDDISPLQQLTPEATASAVHAFDSPVATLWGGAPGPEGNANLNYEGENPEEDAAIDFWLSAEAARSNVRVEVEAPDGRVRAIDVDEPSAGINRVYWDLEFDPAAEEVARWRTDVGAMLESVWEAVTVEDSLVFLAQVVRDVEGDETVMDGPAEDLRAVLLARLDELSAEYDEARSANQLNGVRNDLLDFSQIVGDRSFLGFFGMPLEGTDAGPGLHLVRIVAGDQTDEESLLVRADPRF